MFRFKSPASAGLFFALCLLSSEGLPLAAAKLSPSGQQYFRAFLETFTPLVLKREKKAGNPRWGEKNRDCAGLVRYLFWEAFQTHSDRFLDMYPDVRGLNPANGKELQSVAASWSSKNFTAPQLVGQAQFLGRSLENLRLKTGDLVFFQSSELKIRHVMLVIRSGAGIYLVYHTGDERDELRIRTLADIAALPENEWHPESSNPVFRGIYRPSFLD
jgi:uncharacterized protein YfaT (DUF1175 family)